LQVVSDRTEQLRFTSLRSDSIISTNEVSDIQIELNDFEEALKKVVPSFKREPNVTWDEICSLKKVRENL